ncbi:hypothetical protein GBA52_015028 [Prunus armeniaca]|nr:hypothetical protein GBA52_015028 [Prunus armeniaca]
MLQRSVASFYLQEKKGMISNRLRARKNQRVPHQGIHSPILFKKLLKPSPKLTRDSQKP